jgi:hypothetical protein
VWDFEKEFGITNFLKRKTPGKFAKGSECETVVHLISSFLVGFFRVTKATIVITTARAVIERMKAAIGDTSCGIFSPPVGFAQNIAG